MPWYLNFVEPTPPIKYPWDLIFVEPKLLIPQPINPKLKITIQLTTNMTKEKRMNQPPPLTEPTYPPNPIMVVQYHELMDIKMDKLKNERFSVRVVATLK